MAVTYKYEKPQVKVYQNFTEVNTASVGTQPAFVFGPAYQLFRYNNEDEHDLCQLVNAEGVGIKYEGQPIENLYYPQNIPNVDTTWDRMLVYFEEAYIQVSTARITQLDNTDPDDPARRVELPTGYYTEDYATYIGVVREDNEIVSAVRAGDYIINKNYRVEAVYTNPNWVEKPASGTDSRNALQKCYYIAKVNAVIPTSVLQINVDPETTIKDVLIYMDSIAVPRKVYVKNASGTENDSINWTPTASTITIEQNVNVDVTRTVNGVPATVVEAARMYVQFRYLDTSAATTIDHIIDVSEITGQIDPGNPLWYGVYLAKLNSGECPVYYMSTQGIELERYIEVLKKATLTDDIYVLCPMTDNLEVLNAVEGHVNEMSGPETKRWRIAFIAPPVTESTTVIEDTYLRLMDPVARTAMFVTGPSGEDPDTNIHAKTTLAPNDTIYIRVNNTPVSTQVYRIINDQLIQLTKIPEGFVTNAEVEKIDHTYTSTELADQIASLARHYADRRMYAVFPDTIRQLIDGETLDVPGYYAAAAVAGLCSSTLPQQPLTNMPITGIDDVPATYEKFDNLELNTMAAGGAFIIAQDLPNDVVYVRHQLSTATYQGNLLTRELSITKNVDSISYYLAETCDDLIGKYNVTPELIRTVRNRLEAAIRYLENDLGSLYGPQLLEENTEILSVAEHPTLADHIEAYIRLNPPKPFNVLDIRLTVV